MKLQALIVFKRLLIGDAPLLLSLNQSCKEKLMDLEEQYTTYKAIDFSQMYR